jgi:uncharacterized protein YcfL
MRSLSIVIVISLLAAACRHRPPEPLEPATYHSARSVYDVTQIAANVLRANNFDVTNVDIARGP